VQQLSWKFTLDTIITVKCHPAPDWGEFEILALNFCEQVKVQKIDIHIGADRAQLHFRCEFGDFLLYYEDLCDALWIEPFQSQPSQQIRLENLYKLVLKNLRKKC
jgi:hypothetical protein